MPPLKIADVSSPSSIASACCVPTQNVNGVSTAMPIVAVKPGSDPKITPRPTPMKT